MTTRTRRKIDAALKAKIAMEPLREQATGSGGARVSLLFFVSFGIDRLFRNLGQRLIGFLLFLQRLIQKL